MEDGNKGGDSTKLFTFLGLILLLYSFVKSFFEPEEDDNFSFDPIPISNRREVDSAVSNLKSPVFLNYEDASFTGTAYLHLSSDEYTYSFELDCNDMPKDLKRFLADYHSLKFGLDTKKAVRGLKAKTGVRVHGLLDLKYYIRSNTALQVKPYFGMMRNAHYKVREYVRVKWLEVLCSKAYFTFKSKLRLGKTSPREDIQNDIATWSFDLYLMSYKARIPLTERRSFDKIFDHLNEFLDKSNDSVDRIVSPEDNSTNHRTNDQNWLAYLWSQIKRKMLERIIQLIVSTIVFVISSYLYYLFELKRYPYLDHLFNSNSGHD